MVTGDSIHDVISTTAAHAGEAARLKRIGESALRKAGLRLIPVIGVGYGLAFMDRINISFASLQMNRDLHFSASVYGFGAGTVLYRLCAVRGAVEPAAAAVRGERLADAHHVDLGIAGRGDDVCAERRSSSMCCGFCWAWPRPVSIPG